MAGRRLLGANGKFITPNNKKASVAAVVASNNENLFKLIASEKSHISQVNSATPDFNTVMKNYGTFSDKTWKATVAAEKARVDAFTSLNDNPSEAFADFRDYDAFISDTKKAIEDGSYGPSFSKFKEALKYGNDFSIITARGQSPKALKDGTEVLINMTFTDEEKQLLHGSPFLN